MNQPNPAWKPLLDKLPPAQHAMIIPVLEEWDKGVQEKFQEIHKQYEPLKAFEPFVENNIAADFAWQSVVFADELQKDPAKVANDINEHWKLGFVDKDTYEKAVTESANNSNQDDDLFNEDDEGNKVDLTKIPEFATMKETLDNLQKQTEEERRREEEAQAIADFEKELDALEKSVTQPEDGSPGKPFNRMFVNALMAQGLSGEEAVKQYHEVLGEVAKIPDENNSGTSDAPITMGNGGTVGGGQPDGSVEWSKLSTSEFNENVAKVLEAQMGQNS